MKNNSVFMAAGILSVKLSDTTCLIIETRIKYFA